MGVSGEKSERIIKLYIPGGNLTALDLQTTNADVNIGAITVTDRCTIDINGGGIAFDGTDIAMENVFNCKNGGISGNICGGYDDFTISITIKKGDSNLTDKQGGSKKLTADVNNGDIYLQLLG